MKLPPTKIYLFTINIITTAAVMATAAEGNLVMQVKIPQRPQSFKRHNNNLTVYTKLSICCHTFIAITHQLCAKSIRTVNIFV